MAVETSKYLAAGRPKPNKLVFLRLDNRLLPVRL